MQFRFNVMLNGFVLVSVAVQPATAEALAHAEILDGRGTKIGVEDITSTDQGFEIAVKALNLSTGEYGTRIHPIGDCQGPAFTSAVGHFDPTSSSYGARNSGDSHPHAGGLSNQVVGNNGIGLMNFVAGGITLGDRASSPFHERGSSLAIHAKPDDLMSSSSGNSGDPIACAVIQK